MAFKHRISFAIDLAASFGCNRFRITPDIVSKILRAAIWRRCAVQFESEQTPFPQTCLWFRPAALYRIWFGTCCFVPMSCFYSEIMTYREIERSDGRCFGRQQLLANSIEIFISHEKKKWLFAARNLQSIKTLLTLNWVSIVRVVTCFSQASRSVPAATAVDSETPFICACPSYPRTQRGFTVDKSVKIEGGKAFLGFGGTNIVKWNFVQWKIEGHYFVQRKGLRTRWRWHSLNRM